MNMKHLDSAENNSFPGGDSDIQAQGEWLFRFAVCRVRNEFAAQDLVQDTFLAAIQSRDRFRGEGCPRAWLFGILRHKISDYFRQTYRELPIVSHQISAEVEDDPGDSGVSWFPNPEASCYSPSRRLELMEFRQALDLALGKLPFRTAQAFQLYEIEGQPGAAVRTQLQISSANLWVTLYRARKKLSQELSPWNTGK